MTRSRVMAFVYGIVCYVVFFATFLYAIAFVANIIVPKTIDSGEVIPAREALAVNVVLLLIFALSTASWRANHSSNG